MARAHDFGRPKPVRSYNNNGAVAHVGCCQHCSATATRVNYSRKAGKGQWIVNPGQPLLCITPPEGELARSRVVMQAGPVAGEFGARPGVVVT